MVSFPSVNALMLNVEVRSVLIWCVEVRRGGRRLNHIQNRPSWVWVFLGRGEGGW